MSSNKIGIYVAQDDYYGLRSNEYQLEGDPAFYGGGAGDGGVYAEPVPLVIQDPYPMTGDTLPVLEEATAIAPETVPQPESSAVQQSGTLQTSEAQGTTITVYLYLHFKDKKTGNDLAVSGKLIDISTGNVLSEIVDSYEAEIKVFDVPAAQLAVEFKKFGYKTIRSTVEQLQYLPDPKTIYFEKGSGMQIIYSAAALLLLLFLYKESKKKKKGVGAFDAQKATGVIGVVALGIGVFLAYKLVKNILDFLGVTKSKDSLDLDNAATNPDSFWNPNFWREVKPASAQYSYVFTYDQAAALAETLYNSFGAFNDDEEQAINVFKQCRTQANASYLCYVFQSIYHEDALSWLRGGWWPQDRLSDEDVNVINQYVSNLKLY